MENVRKPLIVGQTWWNIREFMKGKKSNENKEGDFIRDSQMMKSQSINTAETL